MRLCVCVCVCVCLCVYVGALRSSALPRASLGSAAEGAGGTVVVTTPEATSVTVSAGQRSLDVATLLEPPPGSSTVALGDLDVQNGALRVTGNVTTRRIIWEADTHLQILAGSSVVTEGTFNVAGGTNRLEDSPLFKLGAGATYWNLEFASRSTSIASFALEGYARAVYSHARHCNCRGVPHRVCAWYGCCLCCQVCGAGTGFVRSG